MGVMKKAGLFSPAFFVFFQKNKNRKLLTCSQLVIWVK